MEEKEKGGVKEEEKPGKGRRKKEVGCTYSWEEGSIVRKEVEAS